MNIAKIILYGFLAMMLLFAGYAIFSYTSIRSLLNLTRTIYSHPLVVSNASIMAGSDTLKIHKNIKDIVHFRDPGITRSSINRIDSLEKNAYAELDVAQQNMPGEDGKRLVSEAVRLMDEWKPLREKIIRLVKEGDFARAEKITHDEDAAHVLKLEGKMLELTAYARNRASGFIRESEELYIKAEYWTVTTFIVWFFLSGIIIFITVKRAGATESQLAHEKEKLNVTLKSIGDGVIATNQKGEITLFNKVAEQLTGWKEEEALGRPAITCFNIIYELDRIPCDNPVARVLATKDAVSLGNNTLLISRDGTERIIKDSGAPIKDSEGRVLGVVLVFRDQTEEHKNRNRILESERKYRLLSENTLDVIWTMGLDLIFTYVNQAVLPMTGYTAEEWIGSRLSDHCDEKNLAKMGSIISDEIARGPESKGVVFEAEIFNKDHEPIPLEIRGKIIFDKENKPSWLQGVSRDISKRKKAEKDRDKLQRQLLQAQKMESVGRLAGGVAHDFNNMLGVIIGYTELGLEKLNPEAPLYNDLEEVLNAAMKSAEITSQLLAFARKQTISPKIIDLNSTVESMIKMLKRLIGEDIDLAWFPCKELLRVNIDPMQIDQIMANLCVNARDAIRTVGKITIETDHVHFDEDYCAEHSGFLPGNYAALAVSDDGIGMEPAAVEKIFDPFYTTKEIGQGTGLGLSTVYGIVKQNEGFINVYTEKGRGTTFRIYLPRYTGDITDVKKTVAVDAPDSKGETVLIVEDDPAILKIGIRILEQLRYRVISASTPDDALGLVKEYGENIDLLVTDVIMPEMNGRDLANRVKLFYPDLKVLFMSGYTANVIAHRGVLDSGVCFIQKPFSKKEFAVKLREALGI